MHNDHPVCPCKECVTDNMSYMRHTLKTLVMYMDPKNAGMTVNANVVTYKH